VRGAGVDPKEVDAAERDYEKTDGHAANKMQEKGNSTNTASGSVKSHDEGKEEKHKPKFMDKLKGEAKVF